MGPIEQIVFLIICWRKGFFTKFFHVNNTIYVVKKSYHIEHIDF